MSKNISVYFCGGTGANAYKRTHNNLIDMANLFVIDTSEANLRNSDFDKNSVYLFEGLDGSGKKRDMNYKVISEKINEVVYKFEPGDINFVYHSGAGGSGSVIGPVLVNKLISEGQVVVVCMVGSSDSMKEIENTYKTIESYKTISNKNNKPVIIYYDEINKDKTRSRVDEHMDIFVSLLMQYYDKNKVHQIDTADMSNFINFQNVTTFKPSIASIDVYVKDTLPDKKELLIAAATLTDRDTSYSLGHPVPYQTVGIVETPEIFNPIGGLPVHMVITKGKLEEVSAKLEQYKKEHDTYLKTIKDITHDVAESDNVDNIIL